MPLASPETDQEARLAITEQEDRELAREILSAYQSAEAHAVNAQNNVKNAVQEAIRCGTMLNSKKDVVPRGLWLEWLELYLPEVILGTAQRWMRLARLANAHPELETTNSLRQAYVAVGILPDPEEHRWARRNVGRRPRLRPAKDLVFLLHQLYSEKCVEAMLSVGDFSGWERLDMELMEQELAPLASLYERIKDALG
jgi:hypothetical protein